MFFEVPVMLLKFDTFGNGLLTIIVMYYRKARNVSFHSLKSKHIHNVFTDRRSVFENQCTDRQTDVKICFYRLDVEVGANWLRTKSLPKDPQNTNIVQSCTCKMSESVYSL